MIEYTYRPGTWWLLTAGALLAAMILGSYLAAKGRSTRQVRLALSILRWCVMAALLYCLLDPQWVEAIKHQQKSRVAVLLDTSRSMSAKDVPPGGRIDAAKSWLRRNLIPGTPPGFGLNFYGFSDSLAPLQTLDAAQPTGDTTGLAGALEGLLSAPGDDPLTAVVLCSDGIENVRKDPEAIARIYRRRGIPIHTLITGTTNEMHDVVVENVQVKRAVPNQAPTKVTVSLRAPGYAQQSVPVQIMHDDQVVAVRDVQLTGGSQKLEIDFTPRQKGFQIYEARVPAQTGEWLTSNNRRLFGLEVIDPTIRVLYMEGTPQQPGSPIPEWKYLKSALESDPNIKVTALYREFGATGKRLNTVDTDPATGERIYTVEHPSHGFPRNLSSLLEYDVVIHSDIRKESFTPEQLQNTARLVEEFGGGFIMIGGNSAFGKGGYHRTILDRIIPVAMRQENDSQALPFHLHIPPAVWTHPLIALGATPQETQAIWTQKFPLLYGCNLVERAKPGAIVLGDDPSSPGPRGPRLVLAVQNIGRGRSMAFTSDTTRTWGKDFETLWGEKVNPNLPLSEFNCDHRYYRQFWANAVRWLAAARIGRTNNNVNLELAQSYCRPGESVTATIKVRDKDMHETANADVTVLTVKNGMTNILAKANFDNATRSYVAELHLADPGQSVITAAAAMKGSKLGDDRQLLVCETADAEMADLRTQPELLRSLARISGGTTLSDSTDPSGLAQSVFYNAPPVTVEYRRHPVWDRGWWLCGLLGLLSAEWTLRRLKGLA